MVTRLLFSVWIALCAFMAKGETFFIITQETFNGKEIPLEEQAKEGIFNGLFEAGHIVIDELKTKTGKDVMAVDSIGFLLKKASDYFMPFLVVARIASKQNASGREPGYIETEASYALYDVDTGTLVGRGSIEASNAGKQKELPREKLWFDIGEEIARRVFRLYTGSIKSAF